MRILRTGSLSTAQLCEVGGQLYPDATLVSLVNSSAVAKRLAAYCRCTTSIDVPAIPQQERPGYVVKIYDPYDRAMATACIQRQSAAMSAVLKAQTVSLVGFRPHQPEDTEYFDERVVLTGSGEWTVPPDVSFLTAVYIGGGTGGGCGQDGERSPVPSVVNDNTINSGGPTYFLRGYDDRNAPGGAGGLPGEGRGPGGKVLQINLTVTPGAVLPYSCGVGGLGGKRAEQAQVGQPGTPTTFAGHSSEEGSASEAGYTDIITGERYAHLGDIGIAGGRGGGTNEKNEIVPAERIIVDGVTYYGGSKASNTENGAGNSAGEYGYRQYQAGGGFGGGAAYKQEGHNGRSGSGSISRTSVTVTPGIAGAGADAAPPEKPVRPNGQGGTTGNGGGGAGLIGLPSTCEASFRAEMHSNPVSFNFPSPPIAPGGVGSDGGPGADGCLILYLRKAKPKPKTGPVVTSKGKWFLDKLGRRFIV